MTGPREEDFGARLSFDRGAPGRFAESVPAWRGEKAPLPPADFLRESVCLPELSQGELVRYYMALSRRNYSVDTGTYPLGSCTMKYNPKVNDVVAGFEGFADAHPLSQSIAVQGTLRLLKELQEMLASITGLPAVSLAPAAGAQGEFTGMLMVKKALAARGELEHRRRVLVPDSAHGTNPASAAMAGFTVTQVPSAPNGSMDRAALERELDDSVAALMVTLPNTLGLWEHGIEEIAGLIHSRGALLYGDGANLNAILGRLRFGDVGFDVVHLNLHKTFSTPHGGGGPGAGPVCCSKGLAPFLPTPVVAPADDGRLVLVAPPQSIGRLQQFHGSVAVLVRAYAYIRSLGIEGLREVSENAVLNANYLRSLLGGAYEQPFGDRVLHELVVSCIRQQREHCIRAYDVAKRLIDYGYHPPTVYFPLIVHEALMIEPTETESPESVEAFATALVAVAQEAATHPDILRDAPHTAPIGRLDEATAARKPNLRWKPWTALTNED